MKNCKFIRYDEIDVTFKVHTLKCELLDGGDYEVFEIKVREYPDGSSRVLDEDDIDMTTIHVNKISPYFRNRGLYSKLVLLCIDLVDGKDISSELEKPVRTSVPYENEILKLELHSTGESREKYNSYLFDCPDIDGVLYEMEYREYQIYDGKESLFGDIVDNQTGWVLPLDPGQDYVHDHFYNAIEFFTDGDFDEFKKREFKKLNLKKSGMSDSDIDLMDDLGLFENKILDFNSWRLNEQHGGDMTPQTLIGDWSMHDIVKSISNTISVHNEAHWKIYENEAHIPIIHDTGDMNINIDMSIFRNEPDAGELFVEDDVLSTVDDLHIIDMLGLLPDGSLHLKVKFNEVYYSKISYSGNSRRTGTMETIEPVKTYKDLVDFLYAAESIDTSEDKDGYEKDNIRYSDIRIENI
tara:strand:+ start:7790 stop:9019 length:1230 start_codon:yes stop_codon:yes gene_type:complete